MNEAPNIERFPTFKKIGRFAKWMGKAFLVLLAVLAVVHGVATIVNGRRVEAKLRALKAAGNPISCAELGLPKVPDNENAALIYAKAFKVIEKVKKDDKSHVIDAFLDQKNNFDTEQNWSDARVLLARNREIIPLVEQAVALPKCQFPVKWEDGFNALLPQYAPLRKLCRLLAMRAMVQAHDGDMEGAVHSIELGLRMSDSANDPTLIGQLVRIAMVAITTHSLQHVLQYGDVNEAQAAHLYQTLGDIDVTPGYMRAMQGERAFGIWAFDCIRRRPNVLNAFFSATEESFNKPAHMGWRLIGNIWRPISYADEMYYLDYIDKVNELARRPYREIKDIQIDEGLNFPPWAVMSRVVTPVFSRARIRVDEAAARTEGSQVVLALKTYKQRYGSYPQTLDELRAKLGWKIPQDIFSGKDFIYKRQGNGFLLYSLGENLKDDGGRNTQGKPGSNTLNSKPLDDIIWQFAR